MTRTDSERQPNVVLLTMDQQRFDTVAPYAPPFMRMPHFDFLAREGIRFDRAYTDVPVCVASRVGLLTGQSFLEHGMLINGETSEVMGHDETLPGRLAAAGYQTVGIGKMHFFPQRARHGFQELILPADYYRWIEHSGLPYQPMRNGLGQNELYAGMATVPESLTLTSWIGDQCIEFIRERRDPTRPFFLWCSFTKPHPPLDPPEPYYSMYRDAAIPVPDLGSWRDDECPPAFAWNQHLGDYDRLTPEIIREARAAYYGLVTQCDYVMGRIFSALLDVDLLDDALILAASDHGEYIGDHRAGAKGFFHDVSARVPLVVRLPKSWDNRRPGHTVETPVLLSGIAPTLLAAAGRPTDDLLGHDLIALGRDRVDKPRTHVFGACCVTPKPGFASDYYAVASARHKYIWYPEGSVEQLFDLDRDPHEMTNVAGDAAYKGTKAELRDVLIAELAARSPESLTNGELPVCEPRDVPVEEVRSRGWPGYHTEQYHLDVRH